MPPKRRRDPRNSSEINTQSEDEEEHPSTKRNRIIETQSNVESGALTGNRASWRPPSIPIARSCPPLASSANLSHRDEELSETASSSDDGNSSSDDSSSSESEPSSPSDCPEQEGQQQQHLQRKETAPPPRQPSNSQQQGGPEYSRVIKTKGFNVKLWKPLIPQSTNPFVRVRLLSRKEKQQCGYEEFGAQFTTPEGAARAADRALIAMWGPGAASEFLNFPLDTYPTSECRQRYGSDLSSFLLQICQEGAASRAKRAKHAATRNADLPPMWKASRRRWNIINKVQSHLLPVDEKQRCGLCPACRDPWKAQAASREACYRYAAARELGYNALKIAGVIVDQAQGEWSELERGLSSEEDEKEEKEVEAAAAAGEGSCRVEEEEVADGPSSSSFPSRKRINNIGTAGKKNKSSSAAGVDLRKKETRAWDDWIEVGGEILKGAVGALEKRHTQFVRNVHTSAERKANEEIASESAMLAAALEAGCLPGLSEAPAPKNTAPPAPHPAFLSHTEDCAALGADLTFVDEDDVKFAHDKVREDVEEEDDGGNEGGEEDATTGAATVLQAPRACKFCGQHHGRYRTIKHCSLMREALARPPPLPQPCPDCAASAATAKRKGKVRGGKLPWCEKCGRGKLPGNVWTPSTMPALWLEEVKPATLGLMHSMQSMANAAVVDFDRPDVGETMGPEALLAMGLLAEEIVQAELQTRRALEHW